MKKTILALALVAGLPVAAQAQDAEAGKAVFNVCKACHGVGETAKNQVGPVLNGVVGRKAAAVEGFNYSEPMKASGLTWDEATITAYIANPKEKVPGNKMVFAGVKDEQKQKDLIAFLKTFGPDGKPAAK
ncbi:MAG: cytochrome c family protein [Hyphomicrobiaceae bacterium]